MKISSRLITVFLFFSTLSSFAADELVFKKLYSRGDDDKAYIYGTALLNTAMKLKRVEGGYEASISLFSTMTTTEAQGLAESVRFGMREAERFYSATRGKEAVAVEIPSKSVVFQFVTAPEAGAPLDRTMQNQAQNLSNQAIQNRGIVEGNIPAAMGKVLGGTLPLGILREGENRGTIYVQQLLNQQPSAKDDNLSVRHLIRWVAFVTQGQVDVVVQNNRYFETAASLDIAAPDWKGADKDKPHRVELLRDEVVINGKSILSGTAKYGTPFPDKGETLLKEDKEELKREFSRPEQRAIKKAARRKGK